MKTIYMPLLALVVLMMSGCSTTTTQLIPSPQSPVCQKSAHAIVLWTPQWRPDQKDIPAREAAAAEGITQFFTGSGCFSSTAVQRISQPSAADVAAAVVELRSRYDKIVVVTVRELGPIVKIGASLALVEGGTEVLLEFSEYRSHELSPQRTFSIQWNNGGPVVIKGVASLPQDIQAALAAGLQPTTQ